MRSFKIEPDAYYYGIYIQAMAESHVTPICDLVEEEASTDQDEILFLVSDTCPGCGAQYSEEDIISRWERSSFSSEITCTCCTSFTPKFHVVILNRDNDSQEVEFMSPVILEHKVDQLLRERPKESRDSQILTEKSEDLYWNLYFYFKLLQLPLFSIESTPKMSQVLRLKEIFQENKFTSVIKMIDSLGKKTRAPVIMEETTELDTLEAEPVIIRTNSEIVAQKLEFLLQRSSSTDSSPVKGSGIQSLFGKYLFDFQRESILKQSMRDSSRTPTEDTGIDSEEITPPTFPELQNRFLASERHDVDS